MKTIQYKSTHANIWYKYLKYTSSPENYTYYLTDYNNAIVYIDIDSIDNNKITITFDSDDVFMEFVLTYGRNIISVL